MQINPEIFFYIPKKSWPPELPTKAKGFWHWQNSQAGAFRVGRYNWTLQAYLHLSEAGVSCQLVGAIPKKGIVLTHRDFVPRYFAPGDEVLFVCIQADRPKYPYAQFHIVQNPQDDSKHSKPLCQSSLRRRNYHIKNWPQPDLIPRSELAGERFKRIVHMGLPITLAPELQTPEWSREISDLGLDWEIVSPDSWHDYSDVDAILSVRSFDYKGRYLYKPAAKLINAWHAGVPAILGPDSAFRAERQSELDYIEATSYEEVLAALKRLRDNPALRAAMIENGRQRSRSTSIESIVACWQTFLTDVAIPAYFDWCRQPKYRKQWFRESLRIQERLLNKYCRLRKRFFPSSKPAPDSTLDPIRRLI
ncbi:MAG: glycosyltransferase [Leptolyngbyaceae cyanobacterium MO_188.B28]|nr:glycosyltransferase [Leptolyngbyaceae cyanobacterium MO_188.B28]